MLLHPLFAMFYDDCETVKPTETDAKFVLEIIKKMSDVFDDEKARMTVFHEIYDKHYRIKLKQVSMDSCTTGGSGFDSGSCLMTINLEAKPELGLGNGCPYIQGITYYGRHMADIDKKFRARV